MGSSSDSNRADEPVGDPTGALHGDARDGARPLDRSLLPVAQPLHPPAPAAAAGESTQPMKPPAAAKAPGAKPAPPRPIPLDIKSPADLMADEEDAPQEESDRWSQAIRAAPPWLVSTVFHMLLMIVLGLLYVAGNSNRSIFIDATYHKQDGQQLIDDRFELSPLEPVENDPLLAMDLLPVDDPLATPPDLDLTRDAVTAASTLPAPSIGLALTGREAGRRQALLDRYGGTAGTEQAVTLGLEWLKRNQTEDGSWSLRGPYANPAYDENRTAATAMALLAFQGAGNTHEIGSYQQQVADGWDALLKMQDDEGNFYRDFNNNHRLYSQAQATIAICELYGMTRDPELREPAQRAIDYAVRYQASEGGWRYTPGSGSDTSVTGWFVMGLQSAMMAGLEVPSPTLDAVAEYLDSVATDNGSRYKYQPIRRGYEPAMTAEALLCRQYLGWSRDDPRLQGGVEYLLDHPIEWPTDSRVRSGEQRNVYYWYYATQVLHHMGGDSWSQWNEVMREALPAAQVKDGRERGSWDNTGDRWGNQGGRLYTTCFCIYMLEVYYRHLPIYQYRID